MSIQVQEDHSKFTTTTTVTHKGREIRRAPPHPLRYQFQDYSTLCEILQSQTMANVPQPPDIIVS